jgi:hypothetical protein
VVELSVLGISLQEERGTPLLLLHPHGSQAVLTLGIGVMEAFAISIALHGASGQYNALGASRPPHLTAHDLMVNILRALDARLVCVRLTDLVGDAYIAEAVLAHAGGETVIDCRPSDAVAIALRCGAPIRASAAVAALAQDIDDVMTMLPEHVRTIAAMKLVEASPRNVQTDAGSDLGQLFAALERSAARRLAADAPPDRGATPHQAEGRQIEGHVRANVVSVSPSAPKPLPAPEKDRPGPKAPQIRVALVRHTRDGKTEIVNNVSVEEQSVPAVSSPAQRLAELGLAGLGLSPGEAEAVSKASDKDRLGMLLHILAPETKVSM